MTDTVLLTGISGFLGSHVALQLLEAGYKVRGSLRSLNRSDEVRDTLSKHGANTDNLEFVTLDLLSDKGWDEAMEGARYLQHTASPFVTEMPTDKMELITPAVDGTTRAINAALGAKIERIVLTSSMAAIMYGHDRARTKPFSEADWTDANSSHANAYVQSKTLAEQQAWALMEATSRRDNLTTINPSFILGPILNEDPGTSGKIIARLLGGSIPAAPRLSFPCVDVRDVAALHVLAMTSQSAAGKRFATSANPLSMMQMARELKTQLPSHAGKLPKFEVPDWAVRVFAIFDADARDNLSELGQVRQVDASNARALLGRDFITAEVAIAELGQSLVDHNLA